MKCYKQPPYKTPEPVNSIWEVILDIETWGKIQKYAHQTNTSYSWIVRYCLFQLCKKDIANIYKAMENHSLPEAPNRISGHRHLLCLYGDDETHIRILALRLKMPVSRLIRLALLLYLNRFFQNKIPRPMLLLLAVKKFRHIEWKDHFYRNFLTFRQIVYHKYPPVE